MNIRSKKMEVQIFAFIRNALKGSIYLLSSITDTEIRMKGMQVLIKALGEVQAEKFITLIMREPFNYTEWQRDLWNDKSVEEISAMAMQHRAK